MNDLKRHRVFIQKNTPKAARKAVDRIKQAVRVLHTNPEIGTEYDPGDNRRELYLAFGKEAFILRYRVHSDKNSLLILRVYHSREDR